MTGRQISPNAVVNGSARRIFKHYSGDRNRSRSGNITMAVFIILVAVFSAVPLVMAVGMSLKPLNELFYYPPRLLPEKPTIENFASLFSLMQTTWVPFSRYVFNTLFITIVSTVGHVMLASMAAYPLAKIRFPGRNIMNKAVMYSLMFVAAVGDVANYLTISALGWLDNYAAVIIPLMGAPLGLFILRNYMTTVPESILEAARIDGCSDIGIYWRIVMPLVKPAWLTVIILMFQQVWGATNTTYIYSEELKTLPYALSQITAGGVVRIGAGQAASVLMLLIPAIVFIFNQTRILGTMATSGMKE